LTAIEISTCSFHSHTWQHLCSFPAATNEKPIVAKWCGLARALCIWPKQKQDNQFLTLHKHN
jgi:hypothetical protein